MQTNIIEFSTAGGQLAWPAATKYISSPYGYRYLFGRRDFHLGIDLAAGFGTSIYAAGDGVVTYAGWMGSYGRLIIIKHGNGMETRYAHLNGFNVSVGQAVQRGQRIAPMGSSGNSTGPHLHFEVRVNGSTRNPIDYIR